MSLGNIHLDIGAEAHAILGRLARFPAAAIMAAMDEQNELTTGHIQAARLSRRGPETLGVRTNRLRSSLRPSKAVQNGERSISSAIGSNVKYLRPHELGMQGPVQVKAHTRLYTPPRKHVALRMIRKKDRSNPSNQSNQSNLPRQVFVRAHTRNVNIPERAPVRRGFADRQGAYGRALAQAIADAWAAEGGTA